MKLQCTCARFLVYSRSQEWLFTVKYFKCVRTEQVFIPIFISYFDLVLPCLL